MVREVAVRLISNLLPASMNGYPSDHTGASSAGRPAPVRRGMGEADARTLVRLLQTASLEAARDAALEMGRRRDPGFLNPLCDALRDPRENVRVACIRALQSLPGRAPTVALVDALRDPATAVRHAAAEALGERDDPSAVPALRLAARPVPGARANVPAERAARAAAAHAALRLLRRRA